MSAFLGRYRSEANRVGKTEQECVSLMGSIDVDGKNKKVS